MALRDTPIKIGDIELDGYVYIPPMAGVTDLVYRKLCRDFDPNVLLSTEMLSSKAILLETPHNRRMDIPDNDELTGIQLFGHEPDVMAEAAHIATDAGAKFIDINMGCPVAKIVFGMDGAALMKEPELASDIVKAVMKSTNLPVTVKTRLGWDYDSLNAWDLAKSFEDLGVKAMTIHGRTRSQKYQGEANWELIAKVVEAVDIPIFANGDIRSIEDVEEILTITGAAGVAIARATMGKPWLSAQVNEFIKTGKKPSDPDLNTKIDLAIKHCKMLIEYRGLKVGTQECRKHVVNYTNGFKGASKLRAKLSQLNCFEEALEMLEEIRDLNKDLIMA